MGNAVLMPEFYGLGIKHSPLNNHNTTTGVVDKSVEVRKIKIKSTYEDYTDSSIFSKQRSFSVEDKV